MIYENREIFPYLKPNAKPIANISFSPHLEKSKCKQMREYAVKVTGCLLAVGNG